MDNPLLTQWLTQEGGLAQRLRQLRSAAGFRGNELAERLGWHPSKVSRLENGRTMPTRADIESWAEACGRLEELDTLLEVLGHAQTLQIQFRHRGTGDALQRTYNELHERASSILYVHSFGLPGVLQTFDYAHSMMSYLDEILEHGWADLDAAVRERMARTQLVYDSGRSFECILGEETLYRSPATPEIMQAQLAKLLDLMNLSAVTIRIVPLASATTMLSGFEVYTLNEGRIWLAEGWLGEESGEQEEKLADADAAASALRLTSVTGQQAKALIRQAIDSHRAAAQVS